MMIYLMRHAQSWWQVEPSHDWDTPLTHLGHEQARRTAAWLAARSLVARDLPRIEIGSLHTSPLKRAYETARYAADALGLPLQARDRLREADFHVASELPQAARPQLPPAGEPSEQYRRFRSQVEAAWQELLAEVDTSLGPLLVVSHGGFIKTLFRILADSDGFCVNLYNSCLSLVQWRRGRWHIVYINMWDHLPVELRTT
jgi:broad specificity phosphatase PhoE